MSEKDRKLITVQAEIEAPIEVVWKNWINPEDIVNWNFASDDWHSPHASNDFRIGGSFSYRMEARNGSMGFDFEGVYNKIIEKELIEYTLGDNRKVEIVFSKLGKKTLVIERFEPENTNSIELQQFGWQAILNNFKKYTEKK